MIRKKFRNSKFVKVVFMISIFISIWHNCKHIFVARSKYISTLISKNKFVGKNSERRTLQRYDKNPLPVVFQIFYMKLQHLPYLPTRVIPSFTFHRTLNFHVDITQNNLRLFWDFLCRYFLIMLCLQCRETMKGWKMLWGHINLLFIKILLCFLLRIVILLTNFKITCLNCMKSNWILCFYSIIALCQIHC